MGKQLVNFITCGCESSAPFCNLTMKIHGSTGIPTAKVVKTSASSDVDFDDYGVTNLNQNIRKKNSDKWKRQRVPNAGKSRTHVRTTQIGAHAQNAFHYLCRRNACAAMNFHCLMVNWNPVTALPITPTLEQAILVF
jgi:hypothetical protein